MRAGASSIRVHGWSRTIVACTCALLLAGTSCAGLASASTVRNARHAPTGADVVRYATRFIGVRFEWGGDGPDSFDASGFTRYVYAHFGYRLRRTSYQQMRQGRYARRGSLKLGDLVFWKNGGYVAIYTGNHTFVGATVHRGVWIYSFQVWKKTQTYTTARRILPRRH